MDYETAKGHVLDFLKGLLAVVAVNAALSALQYIGAHIPAMIDALSQLLAATATIHLAKK